MDAVEINTSDSPQNEEGIVSTVEICRVCLLGNLAMRDIFLENEVASLSTKAMSFANVKMLPGDGLPTQVCCVCADKLESAYEFKLQVEQADVVLREKFVAVGMKEELFFNEVEVEVHLDSGEKNERTDELHVQDHYVADTENLAGMRRDAKSSLLKDQLAFLQMDKLAVQAEPETEWDEVRTNVKLDVGEALDAEQENPVCTREDGVDGDAGIPDDVAVSETVLKLENMDGNNGEAVATEEHDYVVQQNVVVSSGVKPAISGETVLFEGNEEKCVNSLAGIVAENSGEYRGNEPIECNESPSAEQDSSKLQSETRRSKRKSVRRLFSSVQRNSDEENYFENLNLSSRLKKASQISDKVEKIFFMCYVCDKQFLSKNVLKEHMHSHDEVRKALMLKKTPEKSHRNTGGPAKMLASGKRANKCPYCGKQYLYVISFSKHLKQHEKKKKEEGNDDSIPLELTLCEDMCWDLEDYPSKENAEVERKRRKRKILNAMDRTSTSLAGDSDKGREEYGGQEEEVEDDEGVEGGELEGIGEGDGDENLAEQEEARIRGVSENERVNRNVDVERRKKRLRTEAFTCNKCSEKFYTRRGLRKHAITHISLKCSVCEEEFDSLEKLRNHRMKHVLEGVLTEQDLKEGAKRTMNEGDIMSTENVENKRTEAEIGLEEEEGGDGGDVVGLGLGEEEEEEDEPDAKIEEDDDEEDEVEEEEEAEELEQGEEDTVRQVDGICIEEMKLEESQVDDEYGDSGSEFRRNGRKTESSRTRAGYSCKMCNERFPRKDQLQRHGEQQHGRGVKSSSYKCTQCNKVFGNELTLRNHLIATNHKTFVHGEEYDPNKRIKRVAAKAAQKIIDKIKTEDGLEDFEEDEIDEACDRGAFDGGGYGMYGSYGRTKRESLSQKRLGQPRKDLDCASCNKRCNSKQSLAKHMEQHVKEERSTEKTSEKSRRSTEKKEQQKSCIKEEIVRNENNDSDFESGLDWPMDNHECVTCKKRYSTRKSLLRHQLLHEEPNYECDICNVKFYRKDKLKAHYDKCSEKNPDQVRKCNICGDSFENNEILREHRAKHVTEGILTEEDLRDIEPRPEEKKLGEKIGRKRRTDIVGLECTECNKQYTSRKGLLRHIQVHEGKKYLCDICPKKFYRREHLKIHVAKHNMIKPYKCTRCTKRFIKEEQLTNHLSKHDRTFKKNKETDSSKRFLCEICSKSFTQSTTLIAHLRAHNGIKPYVCEVCSRPFTTNAYLKMHMRTHTQERPYICQYCSRAFARADTLANHLTSHTGEAKYHCKYCPKNFRRLKSLKEHVFIHTGQRPYACPTCDRRFNNNGSRYAHSKRCKQNFVQNQNHAQTLAQVQPPVQAQQRVLHQTTFAEGQLVKAENIKTITIARQSEPVTTQQVIQHQEILMPLILHLTDVDEEVILPEGTKIFTTT